MPLTKKEYVSRYVGKVDRRRTSAYKKRGDKVNKSQSLVKKYPGVYAIKNGSDTTGYLIRKYSVSNSIKRNPRSTVRKSVTVHRKTVHPQKGSQDRSRRNSRESWEYSHKSPSMR